MNALTKAGIAEYLFDTLGFNKHESKEFLDLFCDEIKSILINGETVKLSGFGNFNLRDKKQRPGRNPKTGEMVPVTARRVVTFHAGHKLRAKVEYYDQSNQETEERY
jgi:integration host factor subunit alpha